MSNETLRASQAQVDAMFDSDGVPEELLGGITLTDLRNLVQDMVDSEIKRFNEEDVPEDEGEERLRELIERVALKVGLLCINIAPTPAGIEVPVDSDAVVAVFAELMRSGGVTLTMRVN